MLKMRKGFTLIELLIVVVIIGILAAIAIPKFSKTREKAYFSAMKSDLKNLMSAQEIYYSGAGAYNYAASTGQPGLDFAASSGVTVSIGTAANTGWNATAEHAALNPATQRCGVYYGGAPLIAPAQTPGVIRCIGE